MSGLPAVHGVIAVLLLCGLVFIEETGVPLPFLPGDGLMIAAGVLIVDGAVDPRVMIPSLVVASSAGALLGFAWARALGQRGLEAVARRLHAERVIARATTRLHAAGVGGIIVGRVVIPGLRVYVSLVAGATGMRLRTFVLGLIPSVLIWVGVFVGLGIVVGIPAEHFLQRAQSVFLNAGVVLGVSVAAWVAIRRIPPAQERDTALLQVRRRWRTCLALVLDASIVCSVVLAVIELVGSAAGRTPATLVQAALVVAAVFVVYVFVTRRGAGATAGEWLLAVSYRALQLPPHLRRPEP